MILKLYWLGDRNALLISIRVSGYGPQYEVQVSCPNCSENFVHIFDLGKLPIKNLPVTPLIENTNMFEFELPFSKKKVVFKLPTGKDETDLIREEERKKKTLKTSITRSVTSRLFKSIISIDRNRR